MHVFTLREDRDGASAGAAGREPNETVMRNDVWHACAMFDVAACCAAPIISSKELAPQLNI